MISVECAELYSRFELHRGRLEGWMAGEAKSASGIALPFRGWWACPGATQDAASAHQPSGAEISSLRHRSITSCGEKLDRPSVSTSRCSLPFSPIARGKDSVVFAIRVTMPSIFHCPALAQIVSRIGWQRGMARRVQGKKKKKGCTTAWLDPCARLRLDGPPSIHALMCKASTGLATSLPHLFRV